MKKLKFSNGVKVITGILVMGGLLAFSGNKHTEKDMLHAVQVTINNNNDNHYVDETDILNDLYLLYEENRNINLKDMELRLSENPYIKNAQVFKDLKENLIVTVDLRRPMARMIRRNKSHVYISYDGYVMPVSSKFSSRVPLISGEYSESFNKSELLSDSTDKKIFALLNYIDRDEFLKAQIAQIDINKNKYIKLYPQVSKQIIEFGKPENVEHKFEKLMIFYRQILPRKGWNDYSRVNLDFQGQIIAE